MKTGGGAHQFCPSSTSIFFCFEPTSAMKPIEHKERTSRRHPPAQWERKGNQSPNVTSPVQADRSLGWQNIDRREDISANPLQHICSEASQRELKGRERVAKPCSAIQNQIISKHHEISTRNDSRNREFERCQRSQTARDPRNAIFMLSGSPPPKCKTLTEADTDDDALAKWRLHYKEYKERLARYNERYGTKYAPQMRKWVTAEAWQLISADALHIEDATDPYTCESPNDKAVRDFLLQEGRYAPKRAHKTGERFYENVLRKFAEIPWPERGPGMSYTASLGMFMSDWFQLARTVPKHDMPSEKSLRKVMIAALQPEFLRKAVRSRMEFGRAPNPFAEDRELWREQARNNTQLLRRLIREHTLYLDKLRVIKPDIRDSEYCKYFSTHAEGSDEDNTYADSILRSTRAPSGCGSERVLRRNSLLTGPPICALKGCERRCHRDKHGMYTTTCTRAHLHRVRTSPAPTCALEGCNRPCHHDREGHYSIACTRKHLHLCQKQQL